MLGAKCRNRQKEQLSTHAKQANDAQCNNTQTTGDRNGLVFGKAKHATRAKVQQNKRQDSVDQTAGLVTSQSGFARRNVCGVTASRPIEELMIRPPGPSFLYGRSADSLPESRRALGVPVCSIDTVQMFFGIGMRCRDVLLLHLVLLQWCSVHGGLFHSTPLRIFTLSVSHNAESCHD